MGARVTTVRVQPGKLDEFIEVYTTQIVPVAKQQEGFKGARLITDRATNNSMVISMWDSEEDIRAGENSGYYRAQIARREHLFAETPTREYFDISATA